MKTESFGSSGSSSVVQLVRKKLKQPVAEHLKSGTGGSTSTRDTKTGYKAGKVKPLMSAPHIANTMNSASPRFSNARASPKGGGYDQGGFRSRTYS